MRCGVAQNQVDAVCAVVDGHFQGGGLPAGHTSSMRALDEASTPGLGLFGKEEIDPW